MDSPPQRGATSGQFLLVSPLGYLLNHTRGSDQWNRLLFTQLHAVDPKLLLTACCLLFTLCLPYIETGSEYITQSNLTFISVSINDTGTYRCSASNDYGTAAETASLQLFGKCWTHTIVGIQQCEFSSNLSQSKDHVLLLHVLVTVIEANSPTIFEHLLQCFSLAHLSSMTLLVVITGQFSLLS